MEQDSQVISNMTLQRLPIYLNYLRAEQIKKIVTISSPVLAKALGLNEVQVRKDLALISQTRGKPKQGYQIANLIHDIQIFLGLNQMNRAVIIGVQHLGNALLSYPAFEEYGRSIIAGFDKQSLLLNKKVQQKPIYSLEQLPAYCQKYQIKLAILAVDTEEAQSICDFMVSCGIEAIWNFTFAHLQVPENVIIQNENMASRLAILSRRLTEKIHQQ